MKKAILLSSIITLIPLLMLFSCGTDASDETDIVYCDDVHAGDYTLVSVERKNIKDTDLALDFGLTSKLRMEIVSGRPEEVYGDAYQFFGSRTRPIYGDSLSLVAPASYNCYFFENCSLADYYIENTPLGGTPFTFAIHLPDSHYLVPMLFVFDKIGDTFDILRLTVTLQSYIIVFEG